MANSMQLGFQRDSTTGALLISGADSQAARALAQGIQAEPYPAATIPSTQTTLTSGRMEGALVYVPAGATMTGVVTALQANSATLTAMYAFVLSKTGVLLTPGSTNQATALDTGAVGLVGMPFGGGTWTAPTSDDYYACLLGTQTAGTMPTIARTGANGYTNGVNSGLNGFVAATGLTVPVSGPTLFKEVTAFYIGLY